MKIIELLKESAIKLNSNPKNKKEALDEMINLMSTLGNISNIEEYAKSVDEREEKGSTGIGEGIAIPHGKSKAVKSAGISAMVVPDGVDFDAVDGDKVKLIFLIAAPENKDNVHLEVLSRLSAMLMDNDFTNRLINAKSKKDFLDIINEMENKKSREENNENSNQMKKIEIVAITSCPTGIAHTYMAAEALEKAGIETGHIIKVETQGQVGAKNVLTDDEIKEAKSVIIAADTNVDLSRFEGKRVIKTGVSEGIQKPKELINKALSDDVPIYINKNNDERDDIGTKKEGVARKIYKNLMNGVTYMLPFVVGGGILIAIAFLLDDYGINPANFGMNTPRAAFFKTIGGLAFDFMLCILAGFIAMSIADRPGLAVGFVGGAIAQKGITFESLTNSNLTTVSSGFLGALLAGFIAGYLVIAIRKIFKFLPKSLEGILPILIIPVCGILLIGAIMLFINPFVGAINTGLNNFLNNLSGTNKIVLGAILAGMMSVDLGGPVNKAAYTFGTGMLAEGHYDIMAAVMAGGMVAPLSIAILATILPKKFAKKDRQSALLNYIMGAAFISEGAIPFASADPLRVLPACIIGSAVSGALSMLFNCTLMAPHGGIFVLPVVGNSVMYLVSIVIGSLVGAGILAILKKDEI